MRKLSVEQRDLFSYFITGPYAHYSGIYHLPLTMAAEHTRRSLTSIERDIKVLSGSQYPLEDRLKGYMMGYQDGYISGYRQVLDSLFSTLSDCFVMYDEYFKIVWVRNNLLYQVNGKMSPQQIKGVNNHLASLQPSPLIQFFINRYAEVKLSFFYSKRYPIEPFYASSEISGATASVTASTTETAHMPELFLSFWDAYPSRNGKKLEKGKALTNFMTFPEEEWLDIVGAAKNYAASDLVKKGIGIKDPKRFLIDGKGNFYWKEWILPETMNNAEQEAKRDSIKIELKTLQKTLNRKRSLLSDCPLDHTDYQRLSSDIVALENRIAAYEDLVHA